jgi:hypothetical protein
MRTGDAGENSQGRGETGWLTGGLPLVPLSGVLLLWRSLVESGATTDDAGAGIDHTGVRTDASLSLNHFATDSQSVCLSWYRAPSGAHDQIFIFHWKLQSCLYGAPSLTRGRVCHLMLASWRPAFLFCCCWVACGPIGGGAEVMGAG